MAHNFRLLIKYGIVVILFTLVIFIAIYVLIPDSGETLFRENQLVESLTWSLYLFSFLFGSYRIYKLGNIQFRKVYLLLPIMGLIGFIDETSMGANIFRYQLPYYAHYNVRLQGFKTFFQFIKMHIYFNDLAKEFSQLIIIFLANSAFLFLYIYWMRTNTTHTRGSTNHINLLRTWLKLSILVSSAGVSQLLLMETYPNISCVLGCYSLPRLILIVIIGVAIITLLSALISTYRRTDMVEKIAKRFDRKLQKILVILSISVYGLGWLFLTAQYLQVIPRPYEAFASRAIFIVFLITLQAAITAISIYILQGAFLQPMRQYIKNIRVWVNRYPAYYFVIVSIAFLVVAQYIDLSIRVFAHDRIIEELFELEASIALLFGTLAINNTQGHS